MLNSKAQWTAHISFLRHALVLDLTSYMACHDDECRRQQERRCDDDEEWHEWMNDFFLFAQRSFPFLCTVFLFLFTVQFSSLCHHTFVVLVPCQKYTSSRSVRQLTSYLRHQFRLHCLIPIFISLSVSFLHQQIVVLARDHIIKLFPRKKKQRHERGSSAPTTIHSDENVPHTQWRSVIREPFSRLKLSTCANLTVFPTFRSCLNYYWTLQCFDKDDRINFG